MLWMTWRSFIKLTRIVLIIELNSEFQEFRFTTLFGIYIGLKYYILHNNTYRQVNFIIFKTLLLKSSHLTQYLKRWSPAKMQKKDQDLFIISLSKNNLKNIDWWSPNILRNETEIKNCWQLPGLTETRAITPDKVWTNWWSEMRRKQRLKKRYGDRWTILWGRNLIF